MPMTPAKVRGASDPVRIWATRLASEPLPQHKPVLRADGHDQPEGPPQSLEQAGQREHEEVERLKVLAGKLARPREARQTCFLPGSIGFV